MKNYSVIYTEHVVYSFDIEANSKEEALKEFNRKLSNGEIHFDDGDVCDSETIVYEEEPYGQL